MELYMKNVNVNYKVTGISRGNTVHHLSVKQYSRPWVMYSANPPYIRPFKEAHCFFTLLTDTQTHLRG